MLNTTTSTNRTLNQILNDGDAGLVIKNNKNALIAILVAIIVAVVGFGVYSSFSDKANVEYNSKIYNFESTVLKTYSEKSDPQSLVQGIKDLQKTIGNYSGLVPVVIKASDALISQLHLNEALEVLKVGQLVSKNEYSDYFILSRLAVVYEDLNLNQKAIETLEKMNAQSLKIFEGKNYLDLGRLYLKSGDKTKASASFKYVVEKAKDEPEFVKIANLYLSKI
jgi:predicted negative regulator of RcsB-dependent stress response